MMDRTALRLLEVGYKPADPVELSDALLAVYDRLLDGWQGRPWDVTRESRRRWLANQAWRMRLAPTEAERQMWQILDAMEIEFDAQRIIGHYILDFYLPWVGTGVEIDGLVHRHRQEADARRTDWLVRHGIAIIRFSNADVLEAPEWVTERLWDWIAELRS